MRMALIVCLSLLCFATLTMCISCKNIANLYVYLQIHGCFNDEFTIQNIRTLKENRLRKIDTIRHFLFDLKMAKYDKTPNQTTFPQHFDHHDSKRASKWIWKKRTQKIKFKVFFLSSIYRNYVILSSGAKKRRKSARKFSRKAFSNIFIDKIVIMWRISTLFPECVLCLAQAFSGYMFAFVALPSFHSFILVGVSMSFRQCGTILIHFKFHFSLFACHFASSKKRARERARPLTNFTCSLNMNVNRWSWTKVLISSNSNSSRKRCKKSQKRSEKQTKIHLSYGK